MASDDRRHQAEEKTYAVFSADSIKVMAESVGISSLPHDAAVALGEDASYRMRQVIMLATQYMKHSKRRRMTTEDFNRAVKELSLMPVHGHGSQEPVAFRHVKENDMHCVDDPEVSLTDIALSSYVPKQIGQPSIKAHWLAVEGVIKISPGGAPNFQGKANREMSATHLKYYNCMTKALLGANAEAKKKALQDLKSNPNLVPVLSYLISFVVNGIKNMSHDLNHLTTMLNTVRALLHNKSLYLMHKPYLSTIVQGVEFCVLEPLAASINVLNDHWVLRDYAARLLAEIVNRWNSPQNHLRFNIVRCLKDVLLDPTKPFYSHYGAIMTLVALGHKAIEDVICQYLPQYWPHLKSAMEDMSSESAVARSDSHKVHGALRLAAEKYLRRHIRKFQDFAAACKERDELTHALDHSYSIPEKPETTKDATSSATGSREEENILEVYKNLYECLGDSLSDCLPLAETSHVFKAPKKDPLISLSDENTTKSGEELLHDLMEQIKLQEKLEQERKERELIEQKEREKRESEKRARQIIEQKKREDEEKKRKHRQDEEELRRKRLYLEEAEKRRKMKEEEERRQKEWDDQLKELNSNRTKPQWQQEIELRRQQLEEEMQYSRMLEAKKRQASRDRARLEEEEEKTRKQKLEEEELRRKEEEDEQAGRSRVGLRRRKPVNYAEKDEDISDLFEDTARKSKIPKTSFTPRLNPGLSFHSDISDDSDGDLARRIAAGNLSPASAEAMAVSKVMDPSKGLLKLKIKLQSHSSTPPHPMSATPQHIPSAYHSPSMTSPVYSPHSTSHSTPPPLPASTPHPRSKSSSGLEKETKHKKGSSSSSKHSRSGSTSLQDISDAEEISFSELQATLPPQLHSPGAESSGSDSNPHRKALKLKLKLTPKDSASE